uniref:Uncharacterized protein n=1 Tax=Parascaris equorum TaxID=6256 RepID=A0A914RN55_PAREQ
MRYWQVQVKIALLDYGGFPLAINRSPEEMRINLMEHPNLSNVIVLFIVFKARVGDVGGQAVGYYGGCYSPAGTMIIAHSYFGGFCAWSCKQVISEYRF